MAILCEICKRGPAQGVSVYRCNEKGITGIWRCDKHHCAESFDNAVQDQWLTDILEGKPTVQ